MHQAEGALAQSEHAPQPGDAIRQRVLFVIRRPHAAGLPVVQPAQRGLLGQWALGIRLGLDLRGDLIQPRHNLIVGQAVDRQTGERDQQGVMLEEHLVGQLLHPAQDAVVAAAAQLRQDRLVEQAGHLRPFAGPKFHQGSYNATLAGAVDCRILTPVMLDQEVITVKERRPLRPAAGA